MRQHLRSIPRTLLLLTALATAPLAGCCGITDNCGTLEPMPFTGPFPTPVGTLVDAADGNGDDGFVDFNDIAALRTTGSDASSATPLNPQSFPPVSGRLFFGNATGQTRAVRVRRLRATVQFDCDAVEPMPHLAFRDSHFGAADVLLLPPGRVLGWTGSRACEALLIDGTGVPRQLVFLRTKDYPQTQHASALAGSEKDGAGPLIRVLSQEGSSVWSKHPTLNPAPTGVDPKVPAGCAPGGDESDLYFADLPAGSYVLLDVLSSPDGCHKMELLGDLGTNWHYLCLPGLALPFVVGESLFVTPIASGHNVLPIEGIEIIGDKGHLRAGRGADLVYFGSGEGKVGAAAGCAPQHISGDAFARALAVTLQIAGLGDGKAMPFGPGQALTLPSGATLSLVHAEQLLIWEGNEKTSGEGPKRVESVWIQTTDAP